MTFFTFDEAPLWLPILASILTGAAIGFEREFMTKSAGLRTHTLVCFSCTLLMLAAAHQSDWVFNTIEGTDLVADPTRMAHGILTGIGFLGAGVIFKQGGLVHGLTTAASLWMTAVLGVLYGAGLWQLAVAGTVTTLVVLVIFRVFHKIVPDRVEAALTLKLDTSERIESTRAEIAKFTVESNPPALRFAGDEVTLATTLWLKSGDDGTALARTLKALPGVREVAVAPVQVADRVDW
jgi:putative Mg2+ transporter-C (MgtC) family protein